MAIFDFLKKKTIGIHEAGIGLVAPKTLSVSGDIDSEQQSIGNQQRYENAYNNFPIVTTAIDCITEQVVQDFYFDGPNKEKLNEFADKFNLGHFFYRVCKTMLKNGNCWVEVPKEGGEIVELKILDPKYMITFRTVTGEVVGHLQDTGTKKVLWGDAGKDSSLASNITDKKDLLDIVHFKYNVIGSDKYGTSVIHPCLTMLNIKDQIERDTKTIVRRYAAPIIHAKVGDNDNPPSDDDIIKVKGELKDIYADTEYVTNHLVAMNVLGFEGKALNVGDILKHIDNQIITGLGVPKVLLGLGEGTDRAVAEVQLRSFNRKIKAIQRQLKIEFEDKIIVGQEMGTPEDKLIWGTVEEREKEMDIDMLRGLVKDGLITKQKANDLLPDKYREKLPEDVGFVPPQDQYPFQKGSDKIKDNPTDPTISQNLSDKGNRIPKTERKPMKPKDSEVMG